jgi:hypothetical protein
MATETETTVSQQLADLDRELDRARRALRELWHRVSPTDRIFAIDRLLRDESLPFELEEELEEVSERVREAWVLVRFRRHSAPHSADTLQAELSLELAERERDAWLDDNQLFDALFCAAESYLHNVKKPQGERTFKELLRQRNQMRQSLVKILPPLDDVVAA